MSYLCNGCKAYCKERDQLNDIFDKPQDCKNFVAKSMCIFCKKKRCTGYQTDPSQFFYCGAFKHEKGYYVSL